MGVPRPPLQENTVVPQTSPRNAIPSIPQVVFRLSKDGTELYFKVIVANIENVIGHIHRAPRGQNGPIVLPLLGNPFIPVPLERVNGTLVEGTATDSDIVAGNLSELVAEMMNGNTYVNVHTIENPPGEIRGQIH